MILNVDYHITDRCNRKCVSCGHFIPLVPTSIKHKPMDVIEADMKELSRFPGLMKSFTITGGECTLHPNLRECVLMAVKYFPNTIIKIVTNGTMPDKIIALRDILMEHPNVQVIMTDYKHENTLKIFEGLKGCPGVFKFNVTSLGDSRDAERTKFNRAFICEEKCTSLESATRCHMMTECVQLVDGKLYACQYLAYYPYLNNYFGDDIKVKPYGDEGIELAKCNTNEEVENFIYNWIQNICFHCLEPLRREGKYNNIQELCDTKYELNEWYVKSIEEKQ